MRPKILILADWYLPGFKAGGVVPSLANLADGIGDEFDLHVLTRDHDLGDSQPFPGITPGEWQPVGKARVLYTHDFSFAHLRHRIAELRPDLVYFDSFFSPLTVKTLVLRKLGLLPTTIYVLGPHGELFPAALRVKARKKSLYATAAIRAGLYNGVGWHASSALEVSAVESFLRSRSLENPRISVASEFPDIGLLTADRDTERAPKSSPVKFLFLARICRTKNLEFALETLAQLSAPAELHIYGPIEDAGYWSACQRRIEALPPNIQAEYHGAAPRERVPAILRAHDFFLLPSEGESFGYGLLESLAAGCPVIASDRTPWRDLRDHGAGWALPLEDRTAWLAKLTHAAAMDAAAHSAMSRNAREYAQTWLARSNPRRETIDMFNAFLDQRARPAQAAAPNAAVAASATQTKSV
jgi:glycosyltransferase involved in cell wall biosynthesis